jgi:hypothetical protein
VIAHVLAGDPGREALAGSAIGSGHRDQVPHGGLGTDLTSTDLLLDFRGKVSDQGEPA